MIHQDDPIAEILKNKPQARELLLEFGLGCPGCQLSALETLKQGAQGHGLTDEEIEQMIERINRL